MEERFLLARLQHKDEKALAQLIDQYAGYVLATVRAAGAGVLAEADLEEAAADTFVKLLPADQQAQQALEEQEQAALVRQALEMLEPATKEVFLRYYYQRQKTAQIAGEMQMNASTVRSRLARGRAALRKALQERGISHEDVV